MLPTFRVFWLAVLVISGFCSTFVCTVASSIVAVTSVVPGLLLVFRVVVAIPLVIFAFLWFRVWW